MKYFSFSFPELKDWQNEIIIAHLSGIGFEGFEDCTSKLIAFVPVKRFQEDEFNSLISSLRPLFPFSFRKKEMEDRNWNEEWEKNFKPVIIDKKVSIRASFHQRAENMQHHIIIDPKMAFGTGHHATTQMMIRLMLKEDFLLKKVVDFGCGTGILSILASKLGTKSVIAIDNDENAIENTVSNFFLNKVANAVTIKANRIVKIPADIVLANINREAITNHFNEFSHCLPNNGLLFLSGFLKSDENKILATARDNSFIIGQIISEGNWMAMILIKKGNVLLLLMALILSIININFNFQLK